jgi:hypothetical protein
MLITNFMDSPPFEQIFNFMKTFPELGSTITFRLKKVPYLHVFSLEQPCPQAVIVLVQLPNPLRYKAFIQDLSIDNTQTPKTLRPANCRPPHHMIFEGVSCPLPKEV